MKRVITQVRKMGQAPLARTLLFGMALVLVVAVNSSQAAGFNVDSDVDFTPLTATYNTVSDTTGCPAGFVGKFSFKALLTNKPTSPALPGVEIQVLTLTNGNVLLDPQTGAVLGGEGAVMRVPKVGQYADGLLSPGESVEVPFVVCLKAFQPFQFFVAAFGVVTEPVTLTNSGISSIGSTPLSRVAFEGGGVSFKPCSSLGLTPEGDVFVLNLQTGATTLVSVNLAGTGGGNRPSGECELSANGRFVVFRSLATDLTTGLGRIFVRDLENATTLLAPSFSGRVPSSPRINADGRFVTVSTDGPSGTTDVGVADIQAGTSTLIDPPFTSKGNPDLSADGRFVVFNSGDVFLYDVQTGTTTLVSLNRVGAHSNGFSFVPSKPSKPITADGRFVLFGSNATDLVVNDTNGMSDVFVRDMQTAITTLVSVNRVGTNSGNSRSDPSSISPDGRFVLFGSDSSDLVVNDGNGLPDVFVRDLLTATTTLVSVNSAGTNSGNGSSSPIDISSDGRFVLFQSLASDLVTNDTNGAGDIFVRDLQTGKTTLISVNREGTDSGNGESDTAAFTLDARFVIFHSSATDLVENGPIATDLFVRPVPEAGDVTPPSLTVVLSPSQLWPPNHNLIPVTATITVSDDFDPNPNVVLVSIVSNEPDDGLGDGDMPNDIQGAAFGTDDRSFMLRAERSGRGSGRIYTVTYRATDASGNARTVSTQVTVPHDQGKP